MFENLRKKQFVPVSRVIIILFLVVLVVVVGNGVTGFTTSLIKLQESASNSTHTKMIIENLQNETKECTSTLNYTSERFNACRSELEVKKIENSRLVTESSVQERNMTIYINSITVLQRDIQALRGLSNSLAANICCLRRYVLEDDTLKYYYIRDNRTFCTSQPDEILETKEFSC
ncbi:MAG: hypothetical protein HY515_02285 [Candidatus Aenigmarchaeota archaeon]|nr:hypothetical protein [Candidatus Aenigmarchaeota archaeon]